MNNITFKDEKIWKSEVKTQNGSFDIYSVSLSAKDTNGNYIKPSMYVKVRVPKDTSFENGQKVNLEGFLTFEAYTNKEGKNIQRPVIVAMKINAIADYDDNTHYEEDAVADGFQAVEDEIPF